MATIVSTLFISLDGVVEIDPAWHFPYFDANMGAAVGGDYEDVDVLLLGRVTYQDWTPFWPTSTDEPYASHINNTPKYVVSTTLDTVEWGTWGNISLLKGDDILLRKLTSCIHDAGMTVQRSATNLLSRHNDVATVPLQHSDGGLIDVSKNFIHHTAGHHGNAELFLSLRRENGTQTNVVLSVSDVWQQLLQPSQMPGKKFENAQAAHQLLQSTALIPPQQIEVQSQQAP